MNDFRLPFTIEPLTPRLLPLVVALDQLCFGGLWTEAGYQREIDSPNSQLLVVKTTPTTAKGQALIDGGEPRYINASGDSTDVILGVGCVWFILEEAHITLLAIDPDHRRQGLGTLLLLTLLEAAIKYGSSWATLEVRVSNQSAQAIYERIGFAHVGRRKGYYQDTGEDALILWHRGLQEPAFHQKLSQLKASILSRWQIRNLDRCDVSDS